MYLGKEFRHILVLSSNRKLYMGNPTALLDLTVSDFEGQVEGHSFQSFISFITWVEFKAHIVVEY